jgi:3,4-dihydroxy 2-butanone 4-phosphate synthase/GTP cyclohydrolase II
MLHFDSIESAIDDISNGKMVIVIDDEDRENEGDLVMAAHLVTPDAINFMIRFGKGLVCLPVTDDVLNRMQVGDMVSNNREAQQTAFTVSIDASPEHGVGTGISATDRAKTIQVFIDPNCTKDDIVTPGHIFPLRAKRMGVLRRAGHTEAAVDLARLAGLPPAGVICEIIKDDGEMARVPDLHEFAEKHSLKMITIKDLISYRIEKESFIERVDSANMPTEHGIFKIIAYRDTLNDKEHIALIKGEISVDDDVMVRVHSECLTGDAFGSFRCDCGPQLQRAMEMIESEGKGVVLYMRQEGRGIGLANKISAYHIQDKGADTVEANQKLGFESDLRDYGVGAQILLDLGVRKIRLMTNNPTKIIGLEGYGLKVVDRIPIEITPNEHNKDYIDTKVKKMGHLFGQEM